MVRTVPPADKPIDEVVAGMRRARAGGEQVANDPVVADDDADGLATEEAEAARRISAAAPQLDHEAEGTLCRRLAPRVRRYGLRHLRDAHAANDLMQQVMVRVIEHLREGKVREPQRIVSYVFGMCRMVVLEQRRRESRREQLLAQWGELLQGEALAEPPRIEHLRVADCLQRLAERERSVIVLSFYEERTSDDVASMLGTTAGNVRVIRHRGLARLRACLDRPPGGSAAGATA